MKGTFHVQFTKSSNVKKGHSSMVAIVAGLLTDN